jgi:uncharacterized protein YciI
MRYFAAFLAMRDSEKSQSLRAQHLDFLARKEREGKIFARGRFVDGAGGLVIYTADSLEEAKKVAESDPYLIGGARTLEIHEWEMLKSG